MNYSNFIDSDMLMDISDYKGLEDIKEAYKEIDKNLEFVPEKELMRFHTLQMQQEFFTTKQCSKNMDGKFRTHGMNS